MKIPKWWVRRARQISLIENGGMLRHARTLQKGRRDGGYIPSWREVQAQAGGAASCRARPAPSAPPPQARPRPQQSPAPGSVCLNTCLGVRLLSTEPGEQFESISPGSVGLLCTNISSLAGKVCGHCSGPRDKIQGAGCQGGAQLLCPSAPVSRIPVLLGNEGCDGLWNNCIKRLGNPLQQTLRSRQVMCSWSPHSASGWKLLRERVICRGWPFHGPPIQSNRELFFTFSSALQSSLPTCSAAFSVLLWCSFPHPYTSWEGVG